MNMIGARNQFKEQADSTLWEPACSFSYMPNIVQMYSGQVSANTRQANRIAGADSDR